MEEWAGQIWHKIITRAASPEYPDKAIKLNDIKNRLSIQFRAFGGNPAMQILGASKTDWHDRRSFVQRVASSFNQVELAWCDEQSLRLPDHLAWYDDKKLNEQHYLWLTCLAAHSDNAVRKCWLSDNQSSVRKTLKAFPGLKRIYHSLVEAHIQSRPKLESLPASLIKAEKMIRTALTSPDAKLEEIDQPQRLHPVWLWLHPEPPVEEKIKAQLEEVEAQRSDKKSKELKEDKRRKGEWVEDKDGKEGLLAFRLESVFSWAEFMPVDRTADDDDEEHAQSVADDLDVISVTRSKDAPASQLKFDLDLPAPDQDDYVLKSGILLPEWDHKKNRLKPKHCRLQEMLPKQHEDCDLPQHLKSQSRRLRSHFEMLATGKQWLKGQPEGSELDMDRFILQQADKKRGYCQNRNDLYQDLRIKLRDLSCLLLADLSLSTDSWVNNQGKVINIIRDSLFLFGESIQAVGDRFAISGFSSKKRHHIRYYPLKRFNEPWGKQVKGRINGIVPGFYTRMGAAIRYATQNLQKESSETKLLLLLTDGKPNDLDSYEGRYGVEDTRHAIVEARQNGIKVFCVTIDEKGKQYLPYIFGQGHFILIRNAEELPVKLTRLYSSITA
ncbi:MAG: VWA domain-containing protein [Gammaproteobacteria bacterium]|nr:VWA domain-containing protein [Gammaproteobacteria bacterium]